jgi:hypothetical protein
MTSFRSPTRYRSPAEVLRKGRMTSRAAVAEAVLTTIARAVSAAATAVAAASPPRHSREVVRIRGDLAALMTKHPRDLDVRSEACRRWDVQPSSCPDL